MTSFERALADEAATIRLGEDIAAILRPGDLVLLEGDLGAGKTTLARALIRALAADPALEVPSPTFTLVQTYATRVPVAHLDLYRLADPDEIHELGLAEMLAEGAALIEWPQRAASALPEASIQIALEDAGVGRLARIRADADAGARLARSFAIRDFLSRAGHGEAMRSHLTGDASARAYETVTRDDAAPLILMNAPRRPDGPPIRDGLPYSRIAKLAEDVAPFLAVDHALRDAGFCAPAIVAADAGEGFILLEDLGRDGILDAQGLPVPERYLAAAELLAALHEMDWPDVIASPFAESYRVPAYDRAALSIEAELLLDWYVPHALGRPAGDEERARFDAVWQDLFARLERRETSLVLRDFHSPNIIWRDGAESHDRLGLIDFQDAVIGPAAYDVASLAMDARVTIPPELERAVVEAYCDARGQGFDRAGFEEAYAIMAAQRNTKILGIFVRLDRRDGKPAYLRHLPRLHDYMARALAHPSLAALAALYRDLGICGTAR